MRAVFSPFWSWLSNSDASSVFPVLSCPFGAFNCHSVALAWLNFPVCPVEDGTELRLGVWSTSNDTRSTAVCLVAVNSLASLGGPCLRVVTVSAAAVWLASVACGSPVDQRDWDGSGRRCWRSVEMSHDGTEVVSTAIPR